MKLLLQRYANPLPREFGLTCKLGYSVGFLDVHRMIISQVGMVKQKRSRRVKVIQLNRLFHILKTKKKKKEERNTRGSLR